MGGGKEKISFLFSQKNLDLEMWTMESALGHKYHIKINLIDS